MSKLLVKQVHVVSAFGHRVASPLQQVSSLLQGHIERQQSVVSYAIILLCSKGFREETAGQDFPFTPLLRACGLTLTEETSTL